MLYLQCLGPLAITLDTETRPRFATDRARALLVYLAMNGERPYRREELATLLWPEQSNSQARQNLRKTLSRLRRAASTLPLLQANSKDIILNHAVVQCDAQQFSQRLLQIEQHNDHTHLQQCPTCIAHLQEALALYQGAFLQGFYLDHSAPFEEWLLLTRENLQQQAIHAFTILSSHYEQTGQDTQLIETVQRLLGMEPWHERAQRQLLRALARTGQRAKAIAHYEAYAAQLEQELGIAPESETLQLYRQLQQAEIPSQATAVWHGFPAEVTSFVGRSQELAQITAQITDPGCRLLTLTGSGGMGKTRLAVQAVLQVTAVTFPDGLFFIPLAQLTHAGQIVPQIAAQIGLNFAGTAPPMRQLQEYLQGRQMLLLLDNFEHLMDGASLVAELLQKAPGLTCLVTSRHALNLQGEWRLNLRGLDELEESVTLFMLRAQRYGLSQFAETDKILVRQIAYLVQGMPLALEMAAAWLRAYDLPTIAQEITHNLDFFVSPHQDLPPRHQSMRAVFSGSWQLLNSEEQQLFARMSVFRGEFSVAAARAVTGASLLGLAQLVDRSLVQRVQNGRYLIHELLREFAAEKLDELELETAVTRAHAHYYLAFLQKQGQYLKGPNSRAALKRLQKEQENICQGWHWALELGEMEHIRAAHPAMVDMFLLNGLYENGITLLAETAVHVTAAHPNLKTALDLSRGLLLIEWGQYNQARKLAEAVLHTNAPAEASAAAHLLLSQVYEEQVDDTKTGKHAQAALELAQTPAQQAQAKMQMGSWLQAVGQPQAAWEILHEALHSYRQMDDLWWASRTLYWLANVAAMRHMDARPYLLQILDIQRQIGSRLIQQNTLLNLSLSSMYRGDYPNALAHCQEAIALAEEIRSPTRLAETQMAHGRIRQRMGDFATARQCYEATLQSYRQFDRTQGVVNVYFHLALLYHHMDDNRQTLAYCQQALPYLARQNNPLTASLIDGCMGRGYAGLGNWDEAVAYFQKALAVQQQLKRPGREMNSRGMLAEAYLQQGRLDLALEGVEMALAYLQQTAIHKAAEPWRLQWQCYQVLAAAGDERARLFLIHIHQELQKEAAALTNEQRILFWQSVPVNRAIASEMANR